MNHKPWHWRKRSMEKTIFTMDKVDSPSRIIEKEEHRLSIDKESGLESSSKSLNEKLATVLLDSPAGDDETIAKHAQRPQQDIKGNDEAKQQGVESAEDLDRKAPAEPLQPLDCVQEEQLGLNVDIPMISKEHEKIQKELEEKLREKSNRIDELTAENTRLISVLRSKDESIGDLLRCKQEADAEFSTLMARLDSTEKENAFLRYEFHMLEKELEIQKEEMDYSRHYADESHKKYLESSQKASKLEAECQRLRLQLQKRNPGLSCSVNTKNEIGMRRRETDMKRRKSNPTRDLVHKNNDNGNSTGVSGKNIGLMIKHLQDLDEENKALKTILTKKNSELDSSRFMYVETASRLSQAEILLRKFSENQKSMELARCYPTSNELSLTSNFDNASDDKAISSGSWANALISELEHLRTGDARNHKNNKVTKVSDLYSTDDFVEMEKQAIVSVDTPKRVYCSDVSGRELVPVEQEIQFKHTTTQKSFDWLQIVLKAILEEKHISKRSLDELFDDIKIALGCINHSTACKSDISQNSMHPAESDSLYVDKSNQYFNSNMRKSAQRIIKLIEGIAPKSFMCNNSPDCMEENQHSNLSQSPKSKEFFFHVFQWKVSDMNPLLHQLIHTCKNLLSGRADFENFIEEVAFALDWSINNCANSTNASIARDKIKKHISSHLSLNENQLGVDDKQSSCSPSVAYPDDQSEFFDTKNDSFDLLGEIRKLKEDLRNSKSAKKDLETKLLSVTDESLNLTKQCQEAQNSIKGLESEIEILKESKAIVEEQIEKEKIINEDLDTQLTIAQAKLNDIFHKFSSLEVELEDKKNSCEELEAICLELQLQLESIAKKESPTYGKHEVQKIFQTGWEITTASSKLAECQETIVNLGKQLKALASTSEVALCDANSTVANLSQKKNLVKRSSLLNQMQAEDEAKAGNHKPVQIEESKCIEGAERLPVLQSENESALKTPHTVVNAQEKSLTSEQKDRGNATGSMSMTIVPRKKQGGFDFLRKLLLRRKKKKRN